MKPYPRALPRAQYPSNKKPSFSPRELIAEAANFPSMTAPAAVHGTGDGTILCPAERARCGRLFCLTRQEFFIARKIFKARCYGCIHKVHGQEKRDRIRARLLEGSRA